eukprot:c37214_g1_i1 orf=68-262(-)
MVAFVLVQICEWWLNFDRVEHRFAAASCGYLIRNGVEIEEMSWLPVDIEDISFGAIEGTHDQDD